MMAESGSLSESPRRSKRRSAECDDGMLESPRRRQKRSSNDEPTQEAAAEASPKAIQAAITSPDGERAHRLSMPPPSPRDQRHEKRDKQVANIQKVRRIHSLPEAFMKKAFLAATLAIAIDSTGSRDSPLPLPSPPELLTSFPLLAFCQNQFKAYTSLEDVHGSMFKECMDGKRSPPDFALARRIVPPLPRPVMNTKSPHDPALLLCVTHHSPAVPPRSGSGGGDDSGERSSSGLGSGSGGGAGDGGADGGHHSTHPHSTHHNHELAAALHRSGLSSQSYRQAAPLYGSSTSESIVGHLPTTAALFTSGDNLLMRLGSNSRASCSSSSGSEPMPGGNNGRHSRRSGADSHKRVLSGAKLGSIASIQGRASSIGGRIGLHSSLSGVSGSMKGSLSGTSLHEMAMLGRPSSDASNYSVDGARETPPGVPRAFEAHRSLVACPAPRRASILCAAKARTADLFR